MPENAFRKSFTKPTLPPEKVAGELPGVTDSYLQSCKSTE